MEQTRRKTSVRIWTPLLTKFSKRIDSACLRRDTWLAKVLEHELDELDTEIPEPNSEAARQFIAARLDVLPRKLVTLTLPEDLVRHLDDICERKRIVRDSFFNRLLFLIVTAKTHTRLFFDNHAYWYSDMLSDTDFHVTAASIVLDPIPEFHDPFLALRCGLDHERDQWIKETGSAEEADEWLSDRRIYTAPMTDQTLPKVDLSGLNVYLPDRLVPGTAEHHKFETLFDDLLALADEPNTPEKQP